MGNVTAQLEQARELLHRLDIAQDNRGLIPEEAWLRKQLKHHILAITAQSCDRDPAWIGCRRMMQTPISSIAMHGIGNRKTSLPGCMLVIAY